MFFISSQKREISVPILSRFAFLYNFAFPLSCTNLRSRVPARNARTLGTRERKARNERPSLVVDYADTVLGKSLTTLTWCQRSRWLRGHTFFANIFAKTKKFSKPFSPVHGGQIESLTEKNGEKSRDNVPLMVLKSENRPSYTFKTFKFNSRW